MIAAKNYQPEAVIREMAARAFPEKLISCHFDGISSLLQMIFLQQRFFCIAWEEVPKEEAL